MPQPVVHFEISGQQPQRLREYFGQLFGWDLDLPSPVAAEVSEPGSYGFVYPARGPEPRPPSPGASMGPASSPTLLTPAAVYGGTCGMRWTHRGPA